jgi:hypothetical protein
MPEETASPTVAAVAETTAPLPVLTGETPDAVAARANPPKLWVATCAPLLLAGLAQMYNRQWAKGAAVLVTRIVLSYVAQTVSWGVFPLLLLVLAEMVDGRTIAKKIRAGRAVGPWEFF